MKEPQLKNKKEIVKKLKLFWKKHNKIYGEFLEKEQELEKEMNKKMNLDIKLAFFYNEVECCGIGIDSFSDRAKFPLIHDTELWN